MTNDELIEEFEEAAQAMVRTHSDDYPTPEERERYQKARAALLKRMGGR